MIFKIQQVSCFLLSLTIRRLCASIVLLWDITFSHKLTHIATGMFILLFIRQLGSNALILREIVLNSAFQCISLSAVARLLGQCTHLTTSLKDFKQIW